jgi:NADPH:quinone reductase-like Zn-dependent oxidoreductase
MVLRRAERPTPQPAAGELLIRVCAAGITPTEKLWYPTTHNADGTPRIAAVPAHEFSGVIEQSGDGAHAFEPGDEVFGMNNWFASGAIAEYCIAEQAHVALKPHFLSHVEAATVPIAALTSWQGLVERAGLRQGEKALIQGGAGAVGMFAVQMAKLHGAFVVATASTEDVGFLMELGADRVIDYRKHQFEEAGSMDVIFDAVGGETLQHSWSLLKPGARLVTIAADSEATADPRVKDAFFIVEPDGARLAQIAKLIDARRLKTFVKAEIPMAAANDVFKSRWTGPRRAGKLVVRIDA